MGVAVLVVLLGSGNFLLGLLVPDPYVIGLVVRPIGGVDFSSGCATGISGSEVDAHPLPPADR